jgi:ribosome recycling factor
MQPNQITDQLNTKLETAFKHLQDELNKLRTGRAHISMLDHVMVKAYESLMPLNQLAKIGAPEAQLLQVTPFDSGNLQAIASAIRDDQSLGLNPVDDGVVIRVPVPPLTTERRTAIAKQLSEKMEACLVSMRGSRHDALRDAEQAKKDKDITEDDYKRIDKQIEERMKYYKDQIDSAIRAKEQEIMTI